MKKVNKKLILIKEEFNFLKGYIKSMMNTNSAERESVEQLAKEFKNMPVLVNKVDFPKDGICINSDVTIEDKSTGRQFQFKIVLPGQANLSLGKVSIFAPMGTAVIGYRKGESISWQMPVGKKDFKIVDVINPEI
ncbi:MAG TPA: GreA/GreB family elongation factor [Bacteroidia bacterium]|jgi:regulator of nucleoside diphosphate kinase|nr:GreA/GreB family elongation factor [Bacteroidia bacterium]